MQGSSDKEQNKEWIEITRAFAQVESLDAFARTVSRLIGRPVMFQADGRLTDPQALDGLQTELAEMIGLFAVRLARQHPPIVPAAPAMPGVTQLLQDLAGRKLPDRQSVQDKMDQLGLGWPRDLLLVTLHPSIQQPAIPAAFHDLLHRLAGPERVWAQQGDLHALFFDAALSGWISHGLADLRSAMAGSALAGCISDEFNDLMRLPDIVQANTRIAGIVERITRQPLLVEYDRFKQADLILTAAALPAFDYRQYVCRPVADIFKYDRRHGTDFLYTLYCFITSASSFVVTARKMHLHKNTVSYRIRRMQELFSLDLETIESKFDMVFSCYILRIFGDT